VANKLVYSLALALPIMWGCTSATQKVARPGQQSFTDKVASSIKSGTDKMVAAITPKTTKTPVPMESPSGKPGPAVFVAAAQMHETSGNFVEAEAAYRKALDMDPNYLDALIGYARLEDRQGNFEAATKFYQRAIRKYPKDASVRNDLGLCYHRRGKLPEATRELQKAVELDGESKLYRNNLAAVYVEQGKNREALQQLVAAHGTSVGNYNLGYLLTQKKNNAEALKYFRAAAEADPSLTAAQQWIAQLSSPAGAYASHAGGPMNQNSAGANAAYVAQHPAAVQGQPAQYAPPQTSTVTPGAPQVQIDPVPPMPR
jgi:tetratricopeptide (TPR) repeat protein